MTYILTFLPKIRRVVFLLSVTWATSVSADMLTVQVLGPNGEPVPEVAVFVKQPGLVASFEGEPPTAVMDQVDMRFVPHVLVVRKGTLVEFPNSDVVAHHVYSFSRPNNFALPLYKGKPPGPVKLDDEGVVTLGCNIHDQMLGYIVVVDSDAFGVTDEDGIVKLHVGDTEEELDVRIWSARIKDADEHLVKRVSVQADEAVVFAMTKKLRPRHDDQTETVKWADY
jgi:plastocyanin